MTNGRLSSILAGLVLLAATEALAADPFYVDLLQRGMTDLAAGEHARAADELRIAAFGLIDDVPRYQTAQVYLAVASNKLGRESDARTAAGKVMIAERMAPSYQRLAIDPAVRKQFDALLAKVVPPTAVVAAAKPTPPPVAPKPAPQPVPPTPDTRHPTPPAAAPAAATALIAVAAKHQPSESPVVTNDVGRRILSAQNLLNEGRILGARQTYARLAGMPNLSRPQTLAVAKGLNETSAWRESSEVYSRVAPLQRGEEIHMFAEAVNRYELGDLNTARTILQRALPALPETREVMLYRGKILGTP